MQKRRAYIGLGSNLGDRAEALKDACIPIEGLVGEIVRASRVYETEARLDEDQAAFFNAVVEVETDATADMLLIILKLIERSMGREHDPDRPKGPRIIDLDLLLLGDVIMETPSLSLPHPGLSERRFVLAPLTEIAPDLIVPGIGHTTARLLAQCPDWGWVRPTEHTLVAPTPNQRPAP